MLGLVDPRDVIYTKTRLLTPSTDQSSRRPSQQTRARESRSNLSSDDIRVHVWRPRIESLNSAFALQRLTTTAAGVMVWASLPTIHGYPY
ncbi:hypothetical protein TNCV_3188841 [Trichonephila clavipes]|nr:hypothetical protein TNCV_3188841 [Trichonephila clavipes]